MLSNLFLWRPGQDSLSSFPTLSATACDEAYLPERLSRSIFPQFRSAASYGGSYRRHHTLDFLDLGSKLFLLAGLLIDPASYIVKLFAAVSVRRLARRLNFLARAIFLRMTPPDIRLLFGVFNCTKLAW